MASKRKSQSRKRATNPQSPEFAKEASSLAVSANLLPVVGVGASAGGLEAFTQLLNHLPLDTGMGFVLVQHLDPQHESALPQILTRATSMPVREATNNLRVEANHVYIIPPNTSLVITKGTLKLQPRPQGRTPTRSIDGFFESLAQDQRERAIGVILSGTATDGTLGLEAIKAEGGITFAQDDSARYDSMPRSAIAAGCVDFILRPEDIAGELARIAKHPYVAGQPPTLTSGDHSRPSATPHEGHETQQADAKHERDKAEAVHAQSGENGYKKILQLLRNHSGVDFSLYKSTTIQRRITRRIVLNKQNTLEEYSRFLKGNAKELDALYSDVLINVTSFFRNPDAFDILKRKVFPKLLAQRSNDPLRVWVLGCSTGQEAYSIAMAFTEVVENAPRARKLQVFATDLNDALLDKARHGLYAKSLAEDVSPERLRRFFVEEEAGYRVVKPLREMVVFARQNLINDPPFSRMDLISCRNLLIYLEPSLQKKIMPTFHYALKPEGFLFLGASESVGGFADLFEPADRKHKIYSKKAATTQPLHLPLKKERGEHPSPGARPLLPIEKGKREPTEGFQGELNAQREADRVSVNQFVPPGVLINAEFQILQFRGPTGTYLQPPATGKATSDVLKMAREGLMLPLRAAINKAKKENKTTRKENVRVQQNGKSLTVNVEVIPLKNLRERCFLILFEDADKGGRAASERTAFRGETRTTPPVGKKEEPRRIHALETELSETRDYLQSIQEHHEAANEELQASNEEVQSANEELQSVNEELETSKEELESANEELTTVNEEMANRNTELNRLNADLTNLQTSTKLPILLLGRDLIIRRFSAPAEKIFNLLAADVGRSLSGVRHNLIVPSKHSASVPERENVEPYPLENLAREVIDTVREQEREVCDKDGRWYSLRIRPYMTVENKVDGAVLVLVDITDLKRSEQEIQGARKYAEATIRTARDPLVVLRGDLRVNTANDAFYKTFKVTPDQTEGRLIYDLGNEQWNIAKLRTFLEDILPRNSIFNDFEVTHDFQHIGRRTMLLNGRRLDLNDGMPPMILLAIEDVSERQRLDARVRISEVRFRRLFEAAHDGVLILDSVSRKITDANPFMAELLGYTREEFLGKELWQIGLLKDEQSSHAAFRELQQHSQVRYDELPLQTKSGQKREVEVVANRYEEDGKQVIQCNIRDITGRKRAEETLATRVKQQNALYQLAARANRAHYLNEICDAALDAILTALPCERAAILLPDEHGVMRFTAWRELSDVYREAVEGHSPWLPNQKDPQPICISNVANSEMEERLRRAIQREGIAALAFIPLLHQDRLIGKFMAYWNTPYPCGQSDIQMCETIATTLTWAIERIQGEDALRAAEERFRMLADNMNQLAWTCDQLGDVNWYNQRWLDYTGMTFEEMKDWGWTKCHHPDHVDHVIASVTHSRETGEPWEDTFPLRGKDGNYRWFLSRAVPIRDANGKIVRWFGTNTDVTDQRQAEEALRAAKDALSNEATRLERMVAERTEDLTTTNKQLEAFVYSIAHDLRAPLRAMQGFSSLLVEDAGPSLSKTSQNYALRINESAQFMDAMLRDLLGFSRISQRIELAPVKLEMVVETVISRLQKDIQETNARVENLGPWQVVLAHESMLAQVLFNLMTNALKFVAPDTPPLVRLRAEERAEFVRVWVEDNGIGVAPDYQDQIFRLFNRLHGEKYQGTGVGLAIVQKGIEHMGGSVGVESAAGQGSRFWFELKKA